MNSSINPPSNNKKFNFDLDFEIEEERIRLEMLRQEELRRQAELNPLPQLIYTEEDLQNAKSISFKQGHLKGIEEAKDSIEKVVLDIVERTLQSVQILLQNEVTREIAAKEIALKSLIVVLRKFWPQLLKTHSVDSIETILRDTLSNNNDETRIVLRVHDSLLDQIIQKLPYIKEQEAFNGKIIVIADDTILPGDSKIEWADGGLEKLGQSLSIKLEEVFNRIISFEKNINQLSNENERNSHE